MIARLIRVIGKTNPWYKYQNIEKMGASRIERPPSQMLICNICVDEPLTPHK